MITIILIGKEDILNQALEILKKDAADPEREIMWRYGVKHALSVVALHEWPNERITPLDVACVDPAMHDVWVRVCGCEDAAIPAPLDDNTVTINLRRWVESLIAHADDKDGMVWVTKAEIVSVLALATPAPLDVMTPCLFVPPHEPFYCRIHADVRLRLTDERCRRAATPAPLDDNKDQRQHQCTNGKMARTPPDALRKAAQDVIDAWAAQDIQVADADESWYAHGCLLALRAALKS